MRSAEAILSIIHLLFADSVTKASTTENMMETSYGVKVTGEPRDTETVMRGSERGRWKSTRKGNSLAAYSTSRTVLREAGGAIPISANLFFRIFSVS
jgi:hypothetical protein